MADIHCVVTINGDEVPYRLGTLSIHDLRNDNPNTASFVLDALHTTRPSQGQTIRITVDEGATSTLLFTGAIESVTDTYDLTPDHLAWQVRCQDDTPRANRRIPLMYYEDVSATTIAHELVAMFAPGFTSTHVQASLPNVTILFDGSEAQMNGCLRALVKAMGGGYFYWEDLDLHLFTDEATEVPDDLGTTPPLTNPPIRIEYDDSQIRTRVYGQGKAESVSNDVAASTGGTVVPLADTSYFASSGQAKVHEMILSYTSKLAGGTGSKIGGKTGVTPSTPSASLVSNTAGNLSVGAYRYAYTHVINGGETDASNNSGAVTITSVTEPTTGSFAGSPTTGGSMTSNVTYIYAVTYTTAAGETAAGAYIVVGMGASDTKVNFTNIPVSSDARVTGRKIYRSSANNSESRLVVTIGNNSATTASDTTADSGLGAWAPVVNTAGSGQISVSSISNGPTGTTAKKLYRSPVNVVSVSGYKLVTTINNNSTTTFTDNVADSSLGAQQAPSTSTVGPSAGDTSIPVQDCDIFDNNGGWVAIGNQIVSYTGRSVSSGPGNLTGVPASGPGALTAGVAYGAVIENTPQLRGVTGIDRPLVRGDMVSIWVERNDTTAQAALAARENAEAGSPGYVSDGIIEHKIEDGRRTAESLEQVCDADLAQFAYPLITVTYATYDRKTKSGKPVRVNLTEFGIDETLTIQEVTISDADVAVGLGPKFTAVASSARFSLEDLLRRMTDQLGGL